MIRETYSLKLKVWLFGGEGGWHMVTLPQAEAEEIKVRFADKRKSFGTIKVQATIGATTWQTSIFVDTKSRSYVLPLKAGVRKKENIHQDDQVDVKLRIE